MPLSVATGIERMHWASRMNLKNLPFDKLTYVGIRDIDDFEAEVIRKKNIRHLGVEEVVDYIKELDGPIHISFDIDALDPDYVTATGTPVPGGMTPEMVELIFETALDCDKLVSADVVEFNGELGDSEHSIKNVQKVFEKCTD